MLLDDPHQLEDVDVFVKCLGRITETGQLEDIYCDVFERCQGLFTQAEPIEDLYCPATRIPTSSPYFRYATDERQYLNAISRASESARMTPATVDGQRREVMTVFSFLFLRDAGKESIALFQSHLPSRDRAGLTFLAIILNAA